MADSDHLVGALIVTVSISAMAEVGTAAAVHQRRVRHLAGSFALDSAWRILGNFRRRRPGGYCGDWPEPAVRAAQQGALWQLGSPGAIDTGASISHVGDRVDLGRELRLTLGFIHLSSPSRPFSRWAQMYRTARSAETLQLVEFKGFSFV
jgi:hypothetical protein